MVAVSIKHNVQWQGASPLWLQQSTAGQRIANAQLASRPSILRFASDEFMEELMQVLERAPQQLQDYLAQAETWRKPMEKARDLPVEPVETSVAKLLTRTKIQADALKPQKPGLPGIMPGKSISKNIIAQRNEVVEESIKLFQPAHKRFYLISASLVQNQSGFPDQEVVLTKGEKVTFVVRRLVPPENLVIDQDKPLPVPDENWTEYAFVQNTRGAAWKKIAAFRSSATKHLITGEEKIPLFPSTYKSDCCNRTIYSGLIPVGKREAWMAAPSESGEVSIANTASEELGVMDSLAKAVFVMEVAEPWRALLNLAHNQSNNQNRSYPNFEQNNTQKNADLARSYRSLRDQIQLASWLILLDFANFLEAYLPEIWEVVKDHSKANQLSTQQREVYNAIYNATLSTGLRQKVALQPITAYKTRLTEALASIQVHGAKMEAAETDFVRYDENGNILNTAAQLSANWPDFVFPLTDPQVKGSEGNAAANTQVLAPIPPTMNESEFPAGTEEIDKTKAKLEKLVAMIGKLLPSDIEKYGAENIPLTTTRMDNRQAWFVIRCVYERPHCGPLFPAVVSPPSRMVEMSSFFDPDAPARPIRIPMPLDISPAGLRKYTKNTGFILSDALCGKIRRMRKYTLGDLVLSVLPWPFHKDLPDPGETGPCSGGGISFGMICSLSIPIVTLCAFILLIIMVILFDLFFKWIPWLMLCLPIPGLKGKK